MLFQDNSDVAGIVIITESGKDISTFYDYQGTYEVTFAEDLTEYDDDVYYEDPVELDTFYDSEIQTIDSEENN